MAGPHTVVNMPSLLVKSFDEKTDRAAVRGTRCRRRRMVWGMAKECRNAENGVTGRKRGVTVYHIPT
jgi:hypothetical protein